MLLMARDDWEVTSLLTAAIDPPGSHRFALVELVLPVPLFLVEAMLVDKAEPEHDFLRQIFITSSFSDVQKLLSENEFHGAKITLIPLGETSEQPGVTAAKLLSVHSGTDVYGHRVQSFSCADGRDYFDKVDIDNRNQLKNLELVYQCT